MFFQLPKELTSDKEKKLKLVDFKKFSNYKEWLLLDSTDEAKNQIDVVDTAYKSIISIKGKAYFSTPITSGKVLYDACKKRNINNIEDLNKFKNDKENFFNEVIKVNIENSREAINIISENFAGCVIAPSVFEAKKLRWSQNEYMNMWLGVIERDVTDIYVNKDFAFSDGATMEMTYSALKKAGLTNSYGINIKYINNENITLSHLMEEILNASIYISQFVTPKVHIDSLYKLRNLLYFKDSNEIISIFGDNLALIEDVVKKVDNYLLKNKEFIDIL